MLIAVPAETIPGETRVALVPRSVTQLVAAGATVAVQAGAGAGAGLPDAAFTEVGAEIVTDRARLLGGGDVVVVVRRPSVDDLRRLKEGAVLVGLLDPADDPAPVKVLLDRKVTAF